MTRWTILALTTVISCAALAAEGVTPRPSFDAADTNHDGRVSLEEFQSSMQKFLEKRAAEGGRARLRSPEQRTKGIQRVFARLDSNGDGTLDATEWEAGVKRAEKKAAERDWDGKR